MGDIPETLDDINNAGDKIPGTFEKIGASLFMFNQAAEAIGRLNGELQNAVAPGITFQSSLADLQAISGVTNEALEKIADKARETGKIFGGSLSGPVEVSKLLLSQLTPELANNAEAMDGMTRHVLTLSKTMGGDTKSTAEVLTTAMNQYGISMDDPIRATRAMSEMMNIMAAAGQAGSAELPVIKQALEQSGMAAKAAGVHFAEANAAIQVLDKAGKKGSEGGVALRNTLATLSQGRFLPKDVQEELAAAGINIDDLTDKSKSLADRLKPLRGIMHDDALMTKLFGKENYMSALALMDKIDVLEELTTAIQNTATAEGQAAIIMDTYAEKQSRTNAWFENIKISVFNATESFLPFAEITGSVIEKAASLGMAVWGLSIIMDTRLGSAIKSAITWMGGLSKTFLAGIKSSVSFALASVTSFSAFKVAAVSACRAVGAAIMSIPIIGWIAAIIAGLIALGTYFYNTSETFRGFLWGLWEAIKAVFTGIGSFIKEVLEGVWHLIKGVFNPANWFDDDYKFADGLNKITQAASDYGESIEKAFLAGREKGKENFRADKAAEEAEKAALSGPISSGLLDIKSVAGGSDAITPGIKPQGIGGGTTKDEQGLRLAGSGSGGGKSITMNITQNNHFSGSQNPMEIAEIIFRMLNDRFRDSALAAN